jgi:hypothetical protein
VIFAITISRAVFYFILIKNIASLHNRENGTIAKCKVYRKVFSIANVSGFGRVPTAVPTTLCTLICRSGATNTPDYRGRKTTGKESILLSLIFVTCCRKKKIIQPGSQFS